MPGGTVEAGESPEYAVVRESFEETGFDTTYGELITYYINTDTEGRDLIFHTMTYRMNRKEEDVANGNQDFGGKARRRNMAKH